MGDRNQLELVKRWTKNSQGPYLEVGSHDYGTTQDLRSLFPDTDYVGIDMIHGPGVDLTLDLTRPFAEIDAALGHKRFGTMFCLSVLEHCDQPFLMAKNMTDLLAPGGRVILSVPWVFRFHGYPSDYWRFTHEGLKKLFPELIFDDQEGCTSQPKTGETGPLDLEIGRIPLSSRFHRKQGKPLRAAGLGLMKSLAALGPGKFLQRHRYVFVPTLINMVGTKPG